ncbi:MAG: FAD-dependent oxidoreductase [Calditrichaeota bacterium]|nr:FAD-dependent oxidoreductase [Calditrichota bacterium]
MAEQILPEQPIISTDIIDRKWIDVNIPCKNACPIRTDIPGYIQAIMDGDYEKAYLVNRRDNVLPSILGRVCHHPCESACRHGWDGNGDPVSICFLKRSAADYGMKPVEIEIVPNGKTVAIIGSGPSGLTAANDLAQLGYAVTIFEQFDEPGGMLRYGLPEFRLPRDIVQQDVQSILDFGVELKTNIRVAGNEKLKQLADEFDAVVVAGGCMAPKTLDLPGIGAKGSFYGLEFMMAGNQEKIDYPIRNVIVIGGGFTAVDCARLAYRLGAEKITIVFLYTREMMSAGPHEIEAMEAEGVEFAFLVTPNVVLEKNGKVTGLRLLRNELLQSRSIKTIPDSDFEIEADTIVFAIGQKGETDVVDPEEKEKIPNLFFAGDFRNGASTVIEAAADGRKMAREVHTVLSGKKFEEYVKIEPAAGTGRKREFDFIPRQPMDELPLRERRDKTKEVELGFSQEKALVESRRCYLCHYNFQIDISRCIYCLACIDVMPVDCIKMATNIEIADDGNLIYEETKKWSEVQAIVIDNNKCIRCGNCYRACPVNCITISKYSLEIEERE